ncbi:MAG: hypothetical protein EA397_20410 [Deltaproteobacteria bacterium]|nr:MAG: hypothetical protein EA397_20410 [Deltaproteobacteria bacterium]
MPEHPHLRALHVALAQAGAWERDELERLGALPLPDRIAAGISWPTTRIEEVSWAGRDHVLVLLRADRHAELHEGITPGDRVELRRGEAHWVGVVREAGSRWAEVRIRGDIEPEGSVQVTRLFDPVPWRRLADALARGDGHRSALRDVLLGERPPSPPMRHGAELSDPLLNEAQRRAARHALDAGELALIHGPPGTGKTTLLAALLKRLVADGDRPWALADSNAAVDHLADRAAARGLDVVRVGSYGRMSAGGRTLSLRHRIAEGPYGAAITALERDLARLGSRSDPGNRREGRQLFTELRALRATAQQQALESAEVIASTLGTLAWMAPELPDAQTAVIDEATQAIEPAIWTAVPRVSRLILIGDPHQLGPVVRRPASPLERSLLERLLDQTRGSLPLPMLDVQHRMHEHIQEIARPIYGDSYRPHPSVRAHLLRDLPEADTTQLTSTPLLWVDTAGAGFSEEQDPSTRSWFNPGEVRVVAHLVRDLRAAGLSQAQIAVIAPYAAQVRLLREEPDLAGVRVDSVNAFQGRECEAVIVSWVRSNDGGELGFVQDTRRVTVALTRARRLLACVGDTATLGADSRFAAALDTFATHDALVSIWEEPWVSLT